MTTGSPTHHYAAAGGVVVRGGQCLLLHKVMKDEFVLPKGHVEPGETLEQAALRETREETGYVNLRVLVPLGTLRAEFQLAGRRVVRDETYFLMELLDERRDLNPTHADASYDQAAFRHVWVPLDRAAEQVTFEPARTFVRRAAGWRQTRRVAPPAE